MSLIGSGVGEGNLEIPQWMTLDAESAEPEEPGINQRVSTEVLHGVETGLAVNMPQLCQLIAETESQQGLPPVFRRQPLAFEDSQPTSRAPVPSLNLQFQQIQDRGLTGHSPLPFNRCIAGQLIAA